MPVITTIDDLRRIYKRRVPKMFHDYVETGSWTGQTFRENCADFEKIYFRQRVAVDIDGRSTASKMIGQDVAMPVALAPVGMTGFQCADGEIKAARAAGRFGVPYTLSSMSICSIEDVAEHSPYPFWFQLYVMMDTEFVSRLLQRAKDAGCPALVVTLDLQLMGQRHMDLKNGLSVPPKLRLPLLMDLATRWRWGLGMLGTKRRFYGNIIGHAKGVENLTSLYGWTSKQFDKKLDWEKVKQLRREWGGKMILKGILDAADAKMALQVGADAIIVSNHGGRQLDGAISSIRALGPIMDAVGDRIEVHLDSGIRSGQDVLKALAMGASGTYIGRAYTYGLGAMGEAGVTTALEIIQKELDLTMALCGRKSIADVGPDILHIPKGFSGDWQ